MRRYVKRLLVAAVLLATSWDNSTAATRSRLT